MVFIIGWSGYVIVVNCVMYVQVYMPLKSVFSMFGQLSRRGYIGMNSPYSGLRLKMGWLCCMYEFFQKLGMFSKGCKACQYG
jgi:hypothetical protein